jgi:hypothetical protein
MPLDRTTLQSTLKKALYLVPQLLTLVSQSMVDFGHRYRLISVSVNAPVRALAAVPPAGGQALVHRVFAWSPN